MNKNAIKSNAALLLAAAIWGLAFVVQSDAMNYIGPFSFTVMRYFLGSFALIPVSAVMLHSLKKRNGEEAMKKAMKRSVVPGIFCGVVLYTASVSQQIGLKYTPAGKAGFITALYIVLVPLFGFILFRNRTALNNWISVILAAVGLYLLCVSESFTISVGDIWVIACAFLFMLQILLIDRYTKEADSVFFSMIQFFVAGLTAVPFALIFEDRLTASQLSDTALSVLYTGVLSTSVAFTLQTVGQRKSGNPTVAALLMSMESVFAAIAGWLILHETFSKREFIGVIIMMSAIVISQLPANLFGKKKTMQV